MADSIPSVAVDYVIQGTTNNPGEYHVYFTPLERDQYNEPIETIYTGVKNRLLNDLPQSDWNEIDTEKSTFIKNKPTITPTTVVQTVTAGSGVEIAKVNGTSIYAPNSSGGGEFNLSVVPNYDGNTGVDIGTINGTHLYTPNVTVSANYSNSNGIDLGTINNQHLYSPNITVTATYEEESTIESGAGYIDLENINLGTIDNTTLYFPAELIRVAPQYNGGINIGSVGGTNLFVPIFNVNLSFEDFNYYKPPQNNNFEILTDYNTQPKYKQILDFGIRKNTYIDEIDYLFLSDTMTRLSTALDDMVLAFRSYKNCFFRFNDKIIAITGVAGHQYIPVGSPYEAVITFSCSTIYDNNYFSDELFLDDTHTTEEIMELITTTDETFSIIFDRRHATIYCV